MTGCERCGQDPGPGRFCVRCGAPVAVPRHAAERLTDTAERPAVVAPGPRRRTPPPPPPPHPPAPSNARFPMYADEVVPHPSVPPQPGWAPPPAGPPPLAGPAPTRRRGAQPILVAGVCALLLVALVAIWLVLGSGSGEDPASDASARPGSGGESSSAGDDGSPSGDGSAPSGDTQDLASAATVDVPAVARPNQDVNGRPVTYDAANMLDADPQTAWRMPGNGAGAELTIDLGAATTVSEVGLVNGYAKVDRDGTGREVRWYPRNRRILAVEWVFDDGTVIPQSLRETPRPQSVDVPRLTTTTITLRLLRVSPPASGPQGRDYTAISDLTLLGLPS
ncbi:MAG: discoidin domain-containing protein [Nocardioidaceae bacterium]